MSREESDIRNLESAVLSGNLEEVRRLTGNQSIKSAEHYNLLKKAIASGQTDAAKLLINQGCQLSKNPRRRNNRHLEVGDLLNALLMHHILHPPMHSDDDSSSDEDTDSSSDEDNEILHLAISAGNLELVELLIQKNVSTTNEDAFGIPPLFKIVDLSVTYFEYSKFLNCLLGNGVSINTMWLRKDYTILHYAAEKGNAKIIPLLVEKKCPINNMSNDGSTALHIAAENGDVEAVNALLSAGARDTMLNIYNMTPLCLTIERGNFDVFKILLDFSARSKTRRSRITQRSDNELLVYLAVSIENIEMIELLLSNGATVDSYSRKTGQSALHTAVERGNIKITKLLLKHNPDLNKINREGFTALHLACVKGKISLVSALLNTSKCDLNVKSTKNLTALHLAAREGHSKIVSLLLKKGADYKVVDLDKKTPLTFVLENTQGSTECLEILLTHIHQLKNVKSSDSSLSSDDNILIKYHSRARKDKKGNSALHLAVQDEDISTIKLLLSHRAGIYILNKSGHTPFDLATVNGSLLIVDIFLQSKINKDSLFVPKKDNGYTPVHLAVESENTDMLELFFKAGISADISKPYSLTPLHISVQKNNKNLIKLLLRNGAKVDVPGRTALETPLFIAAECGHAEVLEILSEATTTRSSEWTEGYLLMCISAYYGHEKIVKSLLDKQVDPNANVEIYLTPLHAAAQSSHENIVHLLLERGAKVNPKRKNKSDFFSTPLLAASYARHRGIMNLFIEHGADFNKTLYPQSRGFSSKLEKILTIGSYKDSEIEEEEGSLIGYTALHFAVEIGDEAIVRSLINRGAVVNFTSENGSTPIGLAIEKENEAIIKLLIDAGADISSTHKWDSVLKIESLKKNVKIADLIVRYMCSSQRVSYRRSYNMPLGIAVENELEACVQLLLEARADANLIHKGDPLLHIAVRKNNLTIFGLLLKYGADINAYTMESGTALTVAVKNGNSNIVQLLLDAGADSKIPRKHEVYRVYESKESIIPFYIAIARGNATIVEIFLKKEGLNSYSEKESPFCLALQKSCSQVVEKFLNYGATINKKDKDGKPPLFNAIQGNNLEVIHFLLKRGASLKAKDKQRDTVLHFALKNLQTSERGPSESIIELLLEYGANVNVKDKKGNTPLNLLLNKNFDSETIGIKRIRQDLLKLFLLNGAEPNELDKHSGSTILEFAIERDNQELVRLLLLNGADIDFKNHIEKTAFNTAIDRALLLSEEHPIDERYNKELDNKEYDRYYSDEESIRKVVRVLLKEVARRQAVTGDIDERNRVSVESQFIKKYYERCQKEIELMKETEVYKGLFYFDLLTANYTRLADLARNDAVKKVLLSKNEVTNLFPEYVDILIGRVKIGKDRRSLLDSSNQFLKKILVFEFPLENVEHIFSFLASRDLRNLKNCFDKHMFIK